MKSPYNISDVNEAKFSKYGYNISFFNDEYCTAVIIWYIDSSKLLIFGKFADFPP